MLCVHVTSVLFLVLAGNSALTVGFYWSLHALTLVARSYALLTWLNNVVVTALTVGWLLVIFL